MFIELVTILKIVLNLEKNLLLPWSFISNLFKNIFSCIHHSRDLLREFRNVLLYKLTKKIWKSYLL